MTSGNAALNAGKTTTTQRLIRLRAALRSPRNHRQYNKPITDYITEHADDFERRGWALIRHHADARHG
ncbi:hypothetical protein [Streptomyces sp. NPDC004976]